MLRPGHVVMLCALALLTIGVVMVNSAAMAVQPLDPAADPAAAAAVSGVTAQSIILSRTTAYMALAVAAMAVASLLPLRRLAARAGNAPFLPPLGDHGFLLLGTLALVATLSMVYWPGIARPVNGAHRWITLGVPGLESVQPSELAKWGILPVLALYAARLARRGDAKGRPAIARFFTGLVPALLAIGAVSAFIVLEDLGTGFLIGVVGCLMLLAAGARLWQFLLFVPPAVAGVVFAIATSPYRVRRIVSFIDPYADPQGTGYHMIQSMTTVAGGGFFGRGLGHGLQKFGYLPEDTTDFLFAVICEELGFAGAALVLTLYLVLLWTALGILRREREPILKLLGLGVVATVAVQACINLFVVTGLGPTKGIALPLLSSGGTGWILTAGALGLLVAIDRTQPAETDAPASDTTDEQPARIAARDLAPAASSAVRA
jgi:cell division protein FtsW